MVTIKREYKNGVEDNGKQKVKKHALGIPSAATIIQNGDTLIVFGTKTRYSTVYKW